MQRQIIAVFCLITLMGIALPGCDDDDGASNTNNVSNTSNVNNTTNPTCGNDSVDPGEACDGSQLGGQTCATQGFDGGQPGCLDDCSAVDTTGCCLDACPEAGAVECHQNALATCVLRTGGCLVWEETDCGEAQCLDAGNGPECSCVDECDLGAPPSCVGNGLTTCEANTQTGCNHLVVVDCAATSQSCNPYTGSCVNNGSGTQCTDAYQILHSPLVLSGADLETDFALDSVDLWETPGCTSTYYNKNDAVFRVDMHDGDRLTLWDSTDSWLYFNVLAADPVNCLDDSVCLANNENALGRLTYDASGDQTVYVIVEPYMADLTSPYDLHFELVPRVCGDGLLGLGEECDDGNTVDADGCSAQCMEEAGYDCAGAPSFCFEEGRGNTCDTAIELTLPIAFSFSTERFTDDYGSPNHPPFTSCTVIGGEGPDAVFAITIPAETYLQIDASNVIDDFTLIISTDCADMEGTCAFSETAYLGPEAYRFFNHDAQPLTVFLLLDAFNPGTFSTDLALSFHAPVCGDGIVEGNEGCDDGNTTDADGCDADCVPEAGYVCYGQPSTCEASQPGDTCENPYIVTDATTLTLDTALFHDVYGPPLGNDYPCGLMPYGSGGEGPDVVFQVEVPPNHALDVTGESAEMNMAVIFSRQCGDIEYSCFEYSEGYNHPITTAYKNTSASAETVYVIVDSGATSMYMDGLVEVDIQIFEPICGDGVVVTGEQCDDTNLQPGDGCDANCAVEPGYVCSGEPSVCGIPRTYSSTPSLPIPDNDASGVSDVITVPDTCTLLGITVDVDLTHTFIGDLGITLTSPTGTSVTLHDHSGSSTANILGNYPATLTPAGDLSTLAGTASAGAWTLHIADTGAADTGILNSWGLNLVCE